MMRARTVGSRLPALMPEIPVALLSVPALLSIVAFLTPDINEKLARAVSHFWQSTLNQGSSGNTGEGLPPARSGASDDGPMDRFLALVWEMLMLAGVSDNEIYRKQMAELPGFFRPSKKWDLVVVSRGRLLAVLDVGSQIDKFFRPGVSNRMEGATGMTPADLYLAGQFSYRTAMAMGNVLDFWKTFQENGIGPSQPWVGQLFLLEDCPRVHRHMPIPEPHFRASTEFHETSYALRYELFYRKLVSSGYYSSVCFLMSNRESGLLGMFDEPAPDMSFEELMRSLISHVLACANV